MPQNATQNISHNNTIIRPNGKMWVAEDKVLGLVGTGSTPDLAKARLEAEIHRVTVASGDRTTHWRSSSGTWVAPKDMQSPYLLNVIKLLQRCGDKLRELWIMTHGVTTISPAEAIARYYPVYKELLAEVKLRGLTIDVEPTPAEVQRAETIVGSEHKLAR